MTPKAISDLMAFFKNGLISSEIRPAANAMGKVRLRMATIRLFEWQKRQARIASRRPLTLDDKSEWSNDVNSLVSSVVGLQEIFTSHDHKLDFNDSLGDDGRDTVRDYIDANYNPRLFD